MNPVRHAFAAANFCLMFGYEIVEEPDLPNPRKAPDHYVIDTKNRRVRCTPSAAKAIQQNLTRRQLA